MESATSAVNWQPVNVAKRPGELLLDSLRHVARGVGHRRVLPVAGLAARAREVPLRAGAARRAGLGPVPRGRRARGGAAAARRGGREPGARPTSRCSWDWEAWWACELRSHPSRRAALHRRRAALAPRAHRAGRHGRRACTRRADLSRLPAGRGAHAVPVLGRGRGRAAGVRAGRRARPGHATSPGSSTSPTTCGSAATRARSASCSGCGSEEFAPLLPGATVDPGRRQHRADLWTEAADAREAEVVARYADGPLPGDPGADPARASARASPGTSEPGWTRPATAALADRLTRRGRGAPARRAAHRAWTWCGGRTTAEPVTCSR